MNEKKEYAEAFSESMGRIKTIEQFRQSDPMVDYVFKVGRELFDTPLDQQSPDSLLATGGKLTGAFAYIGQMASRARAERDVAEQKAGEVEKRAVLALIRNNYKVTEAKAKASDDVAEVMSDVLEKEATKNQWENIAEACQTMIMFIQSALRTKEGERRSEARMHSQGNQRDNRR